MHGSIWITLYFYGFYTFLIEKKKEILKKSQNVLLHKGNIELQNFLLSFLFGGIDNFFCDFKSFFVRLNDNYTDFLKF